MSQNPALEILFPNRKIKTRSQQVSEKNSPTEILIDRSPLHSPPAFALRNLNQRNSTTVKLGLLPSKKNDPVITSRPLYSSEARDRGLIGTSLEKEITKKPISPPPLRTQAIMKAIMGNSAVDAASKFQSKYQVKPVDVDSKPQTPITQNVRTPEENKDIKDLKDHDKLIQPASTRPVVLQAIATTVPLSLAVPTATSLPPAPCGPTVPSKSSPVVDYKPTSNPKPMSEQSVSKQEENKPDTEVSPDNCALSMVAQKSEREVMGGSSTGQAQIISQERIVYLNDALSGLHGPKFRAISQDIYRTRRALYESHKRRMDDSNLHDFLEQRADEYMRRQYQNKYGILESAFVPSAGPRVNKISLEKSEQARPSMQEAIAALRKVNLNIAKSHAKYTAEAESNSFLGKRTIQLYDRLVLH